MTADPGKAPRQQSRRNIWERAVFRWESAVVVALTILGTSASTVFSARGAVPEWSWLACLFLGIGGEVALILASLQESMRGERSDDSLQFDQPVVSRSNQLGSSEKTLLSPHQLSTQNLADKRPLFLSYAQQDIGIAERVCRFLEGHGQPCWYAERDERAGHHWGAEIVDAIDRSVGLVLVLSSAANESENVQNEVLIAAKYGRPRYPVLIEQVKPRREILLHITAFHWVEAWSGKLEDHLERLLAGIKARNA